jgi:hypothetical protein
MTALSQYKSQLRITLAAALFTWTLALALRMRGIGEANPEQTRPTPNQTMGQWLLFGLLWGLIALSNSALLLFLSVCGIWILLGTAGLKNAAFLATIAPWTIRNWRVFHTFIPMRDSLGADSKSAADPAPTDSH